MSKIEHPKFRTWEISPHRRRKRSRSKNANAGALPKFTNHPTQTNAC